MLLTKVTLNDFGVYRGRNEFDFKTSPQKPIIHGLLSLRYTWRISSKISRRVLLLKIDSVIEFLHILICFQEL